MINIARKLVAWESGLRLLGAGIALILVPVSSLAQSTATTTQTLNATVVPLGGLVTLTSSLPLSKATSSSGSFTGSMSISYRARTTQGSGQGAITLKATSDFTPSGGPSITQPPTAMDTFKYVCSGATLGTACSGLQTISTSAATNVVTIGASTCTGGGAPCSSADPNMTTVTFILTDDPKYKTGSYSATLTWTISAS